MKKIYSVLCVVLLTSGAYAQTIWNGPTVTFSKAAFADQTQEENQDRITNTVWITRASNQGLFNAASEMMYEDFVSPAGTEWAFGTTDDLDNLFFESWEGTVSTETTGPPDAVGQDMVVHLIDDDIYIDIKFLSWGVGPNGGGTGGGEFSYERASNQFLSSSEFDAPEISLFPNPTNDLLRVTGIESAVRFNVFNSLGQSLKNGLINDGQQIDVSGFDEGIYFIQVGDYRAMPFVKN